MTIAARTRITAALIGVGLSASFALGGCAFLPRLPHLPSVPNVQQSDSSTDSSTDPAASPGDGSNPLLGQKVPDTFPTSAVPLPNLEVITSIDVGTGWSIVFKSADPVADAAAEGSALAAAGYNTIASTTDTGGTFAAYVNDNYQVQVTGADAAHSGYDSAALIFVVAKLN